MKPARTLTGLAEIMAVLRDPQAGCPWDLRQSFRTIAPYTVEEAYEVQDAIERNDLDGLRDELGDLLLQVVYHARLAEELGAFTLPDVVEAINAKMIRRHPHVFAASSGDGDDGPSLTWDQLKARERADADDGRNGSSGLLDDIGNNAPALTTARRVQERAASVGFDWPDATGNLAKLQEELDELSAAVAANDRDRIEDELGDLLFAAINLSRVTTVDPEAALRATIAKFRRRFAHIETVHGPAAGWGDGVSLDDMEQAWIDAKRVERSSPES